MGRNTDKLYVTQSEHSGAEGRHGASTGISHRKVASGKRHLPYFYCSLTLQPWEHPVCFVGEDKTATIFELLSIVPWLQKKGTNPLNGEPLDAKDLLKLNFAQNDQGEYCDPVTMKVFNDHTHIVAIKTSGNVYAFETIDRLNYKTKNWKDLLTDESFTRAEVITIQDQHGISANEVSQLAQVQGATEVKTTLRKAQEPALSEQAKELKVQAARAAIDALRAGDSSKKAATNKVVKTTITQPLPYNAANYSTGYTAASFTSTGMTVNTANDRAILTEEQYMLHPKKIKFKGLAIIKTNYGNLDLELWPEHAPKAVYNFVKLAKSGYYANVIFHRNIPGFMLQGGDPTGRGTGGKSIFAKDFEDEISPQHTHDRRGVLSMANKGPGTNSSQFFITYDSAKHLDKKHTIFGRVIGDMTVLDVLERVPLIGDKPKTPIVMEDIQVVVDPFDEFLAREKAQRDTADRKRGMTEDDLQTWTNQPIKNKTNSVHGSTSTSSVGEVGKYLSPTSDMPTKVNPVVSSSSTRPVKKSKTGGFGNFSSW